MGEHLRPAVTGQSYDFFKIDQWWVGQRREMIRNVILRVFPLSHLRIERKGRRPRLCPRWWADVFFAFADIRLRPPFRTGMINDTHRHAFLD